MDDIKVFIVNLGRYNEGLPTGAWFTLPIDPSDLKERLGLDGTHEEYAIHDYESPLTITEYTSIAELNKLYNSYSALADNADSSIVNAAQQIINNWFTGLEDLADHVDDIVVYDGVDSMEDIARDAVESGAVFGEIPAHLQSYIDYDALVFVAE